MFQMCIVRPDWAFKVHEPGDRNSLHSHEALVRCERSARRSQEYFPALRRGDFPAHVPGGGKPEIDGCFNFLQCPFFGLTICKNSRAVPAPPQYTPHHLRWRRSLLHIYTSASSAERIILQNCSTGQALAISSTSRKFRNSQRNFPDTLITDEVTKDNFPASSRLFSYCSG